MEIINNMQSAWKDDSFYVQTISTNGVSILRAGAVGFLASRISGVGLPKDQAVYSVIYKIAKIFLDFIEKKFIEKPLLSDEHLEKSLRFFIKGELCQGFAEKVYSLTGKKVVIFSWKDLLFSRKVRFDFIKVIFVNLVINGAIDFTTSLVFPKPREAS